MEKAALTISIISLLIAAFSLGWNIYKDIILKPKIKLSFGVKSITHDSHLNGETIISIQGVNMGPGQVTVGMLSIKDTSIWK
jgi:hypothetical protein